MACKNCNKTLAGHDNFCNDCGAPVVTHRLTLKHIFSEFFHSFFSIDSNKPILTFIDLFKKPEMVIGGYINGTRKKYIHAFGYFTIAVTISSIFYFVMLRFFADNLSGTMEIFQDNSAQKEFGKGIQRSVFEYQTLIFFMLIPLLALMSWIVFLNKKRYNYAEHLVINLYCYSHISIVSILLFCLTIWNNKLFSIATFSTIGLQIIYYSYIFKRLFGLSFFQLLLKFGLFILLLAQLYLIVIIVVAAILYA